MRVYLFPDPSAEGIRVLRSLLAGIDTMPDPEWSNESPDAPHLFHIQVANDGGRLDGRIIRRALLRVTVTHQVDTVAQDVAQVCQALLLAYGGDAALATLTEGSDPIQGRDPDSGDHFSTFTVNAVLSGHYDDL